MRPALLRGALAAFFWGYWRVGCAAVVPRRQRHFRSRQGARSPWGPRYPRRRPKRLGPHEYGAVIADEARYEQVIQPMVASWQESGAARQFWRLKPLQRLVEVPLFADSGVTRLLQLADLVAHAVYVYYQTGSRQFIGPLLRSFVQSSGVMHGLMHLSPDHETCPVLLASVV